MSQQSTRRLLVLLSLLLLVLFAGAGYFYFDAVPSAVVNKPEDRLAAASKPKSSLLGEGAFETAAAVDEHYRPQVDRRFRLARSLLQNGGWQDSVWALERVAKPDWQAVEPFSEPPGFEELLEALGAPRRATKIANEPESWLVEGMPAALAVREHFRESRPTLSPEEQLALAQNAIVLAFTIPDPLEIADELFAFAIAQLVLAEKALKQELVSERAVLARALGFGEYAAVQSAPWAPSALRSFLTYEDKALQKITSDTALTRALQLRRLLELNEVEAAIEMRRKIPRAELNSMTGVATSLRAEDLRSAGLAAALCDAPLELHLASLAGTDTQAMLTQLNQSKTDKEQFTRKGEVLAQLVVADVVAGPNSDALSYFSRSNRWIDRSTEGLTPQGEELLRAFGQLLVVGCTHALVEYAFAKKGVASKFQAEIAQAALDRLPESLRQFARWVDARAALEASRRLDARVVESFSKQDQLGAAALVQGMGPMLRDLEGNDPALLPAARALGARLDTRPQHLRFLATHLADLLLDQRYFQYGMRNWHRFAGREDLRLKVWWEGYVESVPNEAPEVELSRRQAELEALVKERESTSGGDWLSHLDLGNFYLKTQNFEKAEQLAAEWLRRNPGLRGFGYEWAVCTRAQALLEQGNLVAALKSWRLVAQSYKLSTIMQGVRIMLARKDYQLATDLAQRALARYPESVAAIAQRAEVEWAKERPEQAELLLAASLTSIPNGSVALISESFFRQYKKRSAAETGKAAEMLMRSGVDVETIDGASVLFENAQLHDHCFALFESAPSSGMRALRRIVRTYPCKKAISNKEEALAWVESLVPPPARSILAGHAFELEEDDLLWGLSYPGLEKRTETSDYIWALRAAAALRDGSKQRPETLARFQQPGKKQRYHAIGSYLVGASSLSELLQVAGNPRLANEVAYYLGLRAKSEKRNAEAVIWNRASIETGEWQSAEYTYAMRVLREFYKAPGGVR